jgi:cytochrome c553
VRRAELLRTARLLMRGGQCTQCHLAGYLGAGTAPRLAGQSAAYLSATMLAFRSGARANNAAMSALLGRQSDAAIATLAAYLAAFQP